MSTVEHVTAFAVAQPRPLVRAHLLTLVVVTFPLWWLAGLFAFVWPIVGFFLLLALIRQGHVLFPRAFGAWLLLLAWAPLSVVEVSSASDGLLFAQRLATLVAGALFFLYIFNSSRETLPDRAIINVLTLFWAMLVVGGLIAVLLPNLEFRSPFELLLPPSLAANQYVHDLVYVDFAQVQTFLGYPVGRPAPFYGFTNAWGAGVAMLTPIAVAGLSQSRSALGRRLLLIILVLSIVPIVVSLNRGVWLVLTLALAYTGVRFALAQRLNAVAGIVGLVGFLLILLFLTPLGGLLTDRLATPHSNQGREALYDESLDRTQESPLIGHGGPLPQEDGTGPPVGTHSQLFFLSISYGIPALLLFVAWFAITFLRAGRSVSGPVFWAHVALLVFLMEAPYYFLQMHVVVAMIIAAFIWRAVVRAPGPVPNRNPRSRTA